MKQQSDPILLPMNDVQRYTLLLWTGKIESNMAYPFWESHCLLQKNLEQDCLATSLRGMNFTQFIFFATV